MNMRIVLLGLMLALAAASVQAQEARRPTYVSVIGTIEKADSGAKTLALKTDKGETPVIKYDDRTQFIMLPAGETDAKKGTRAAAGDVAAGDRVIARMLPEDQTKPAVFVYFSKQSQLAALHKRTEEEWATQSVYGTVKGVDPASKKIVITARGGFGPPKDVTLDLSGRVEFERFSLDTGKYEASTEGLTPIQMGDQVRLIGQKNADGSEIKVEAIQSATFKSLPVTVKSVDAATSTILATDLVSKKPITIAVKADTQLKRLDDQTALQMARRLNPTFQADTPARGGRGGQGFAGNAGGGNAGAGFAGRGAGGGRGGRGGDPNRILDQQPTIQLADLKAGEPVVVTGGPSADMAKLTATSVVAGVDPILRAAPDRGPDPLAGNWNFGDLGGGGQE